MTVTAPLLFIAGNAVAQSDEPLEEIVTTGSRIARDPNLTGALPIQSVDAEDIQLSGEFSLSDVINDVPALLFSVTSEQSIDTAGVTDGANVLNLRGLGINRTLTLVNGRRHVGGVQGSSAVDVGSIPRVLVERVEVLTGGASAVYGADAVTGVVNFVMKDDFEGFQIDANYGISGEGDGQQTSISATWGTNFADDRGNFAISVEYAKDEGLSMGDRPGANFGTGGDWVNPMLRFQQGDINANTPLFADYYNFDNTGLIDFGLRIPTADDFIADYNASFGTTLTTADLSQAELDLIARGANSPERAVFPEVTFPFTSGYGYVIAGDPFSFTGFDPDVPIDLNGNGTPDCLDSFHGYNSTFGAASFGVVGGCWVADRQGNYSVVQDGLVSGNFQGFGGSSFDVYRQDYFDFLLPDEKISVNLLGRYDLTDTMRLFAEAKYVTQELDTSADPNSFWDLIYGAPDNPFVPQFIRDAAALNPGWDGGAAITVDPLGFNSVRTTERETMRFVVGLEGAFANDWGYEVSANYGRHERDIRRTGQIINDRWFAALDVTTDGSGNPVCRSSLDPTAAALNTPFNIPAYEEGYFTFAPGDGSCVPLNMWAGETGITQAARDFMTVNTWDNVVVDQLVFAASMYGDTSNWFELPAGAIAFAAGVEYREETSDATFDEWQRGILPAGSPFGAGTFIGDVSDNTSLVFRPQLSTNNEFGEYDVSEVFVEASVPLLSDLPAVYELTAEFAARLSDYSSIGDTTAWKANIIYAPIESLAFRATYNEAVRAPNITELFGPQVGATFRPDDPCDTAQINAIRTDNPTLADQVQANCLADFQNRGIANVDSNGDPLYLDANGNYIFADPLSASFGGLTGGNPDLEEEAAETFTAGLVWQPDFLEGFNFTFDYWSIEIEDAIEDVTSQNTVDGCYRGAVLNTTFCDLFERNADSSSLQAGGFTFLQQTTINFAKLETSGYDLTASYAFEVGANDFDVALQATKVNELDNFENPLDLTAVNPELREIGRPEYAGNIYFNWSMGDFGLGWQSQYIGEMLYRGIEVETALSLYGPTVFNGETWVHDLNGFWNVNDQTRIYGGIKNVSDEMPFITDNAYPASPRGRFFFVGVDFQM